MPLPTLYLSLFLLLPCVHTLCQNTDLSNWGHKFNYQYPTVREYRTKQLNRQFFIWIILFCHPRSFSCRRHWLTDSKVYACVCVQVCICVYTFVFEALKRAPRLALIHWGSSCASRDSSTINSYLFEGIRGKFMSSDCCEN